MPRLPVIRRIPRGKHSPRQWFAGLAVLGLLAILGPGVQPATAAAQADTNLLVVHLDEITAVARPGGKVRMSGTVTNTTAETWTRVNLHAFSSQAPILEGPLLAAAAGTDPADYVGPRVTVPGTFDTIESLQAGQSAEFSLSVPVELLGIDAGEGVYWIGVHALGDSSVPRDGFADGKARTFIPYVERPAKRSQVPVSLVLPVRGPVLSSANGKVTKRGRWLRSLSPGGSYDQILATAEEAGTTPYSIVVDPGVLMAVQRLSLGNPKRSLLPDPTVAGQEPEQPAQAPEAETEDLTDRERELADVAKSWLERFVRIASQQDVWSLPFADLDVSAASRNEDDLIGRATQRSQEVMTSLGLTYRPILAPADAVLRPEVLPLIAPETLILLGDSAFEVPSDAPTSMVSVSGHRINLTSTGAAAGGPGPTEATDPLAMRQRLLSEAAMRRGKSPTPITLTLPSGWSSTDADKMFEVFDQPWLAPATLSDIAGQSASEVELDSLVYDEESAAGELPQTNFTEAGALIEQGSLMEQVLSRQTLIERQVLDEALATVSTQVRTRPAHAAHVAEAANDDLARQLASIKVLAPKVVTLSSDSGPIGITLINGLDQPVTVSIATQNDDDIHFAGTDARELNPRSRTLVRLEARTDRAGVHDVHLLVTSEEGQPLGAGVDLPIRAAQVSGLIWLAMAGGAALFVVAIATRVRRRLRERHNVGDDS